MIIRNKGGAVIFDGELANLSEADLSGADMRFANLRGAKISIGNREVTL